MLIRKVTRWPPDYAAVLRWRMDKLALMRRDHDVRLGAYTFYGEEPVQWIDDWVDTVDPRNAAEGRLVRMPFILFNRQRELIQFFHECLSNRAGGIVEKSRDMGATWAACAYAVWLWLFRPGSSVGFGSRKAQLVDRLGDMDSIFEKIRYVVSTLPPEMKPARFESSYMKLINHDNESSITGESGDEIGRGGRKTIFFKDEAQPLDARVLTPTGWKLMAAIEVGDRVCGPDGGTRKVVRTNDCGVHDVMRVTFSDGTWTECSPNHLWTVDKIWGRRARLTMRTSELAADLRYESPSGQVQYKYRVPVPAAVQFDHARRPVLDPYVVGVLLGDGSVGAGAVRLSSADDELIEEVRCRLPAGVIVTRQAGPYSYGIVDERGRWGRSRSRARLAIEDAGIRGMRHADKRVPAEYKFSSPGDRLLVLQGLMDTDGHAGPNGASFNTTSAALAEDVMFLVQSLGGTATMNIKTHPTGAGGYSIHVALPHFVPFKLSRKVSAMRPRCHSPGRTIVSIVRVDRRPVRCISVDHPDGLYLTDNCIVTHNSAHYEHPEYIEAALSENTDVQMDISSVNGVGNVFHRRREAAIDWVPGIEVRTGSVYAFVLDWRDHPAKTGKWYEDRRRRFIDEGLEHVFAQEVDRNYSAAVQNTIIRREWVMSAIDAHVKLGIPTSGGWFGGLDVADGGGDRNALVKRRGIVLRHAVEWGERDTGVTARRAVQACADTLPIEVQYDCIGVGSGVKAETNRLLDEKIMPHGISFQSWDAGASVLLPDDRVIPDDADSPLNRDYYSNLKAQAWWSLRCRFERTHRAVTEGVKYDFDDLISIPSDLPLLRQIEKELLQPTMSLSSRSMKLLVDKAPDGTRSPNIADAIVMCYFPTNIGGFDGSLSWV